MDPQPYESRIFQFLEGYEKRDKLAQKGAQTFFYGLEQAIEIFKAEAWTSVRGWMEQHHKR